MGTMPSEAALQVRVDALGQLALKFGWVRRARARAVSGRRLTIEAKLFGNARERACDRRHGRLSVAHQRDPITRELGIPGAERVSRSSPGADPRNQRISLGKRLRVVAAAR